MFIKTYHSLTFFALFYLIVSFSVQAQVCITNPALPKTAAQKKQEKAAITRLKNVEGYSIFVSSCQPCHGIYDANIGPALVQGAQMYHGDIKGLVAWLKNPTRKRRGGAQMPPQSHLSPKELNAVAAWVLAIR